MNQAYYIIYQFMTDKLAIPKPALDVFAIIYSFSGSGQGVFAGSRNYISKLSGISVREISRAFSYLLDRGLVVKGTAPSPVKVSYAIAAQYQNMHELSLERSDKAPMSGAPSHFRSKNTDSKEQDSTVPHRQGHCATQAGSLCHTGRVTVPHRQGHCATPAHNNETDNETDNELRYNGRDAQRKGKEKKENSYIPKYGNFDIRDALAAALERSYGKKVNREDID